ncbi:MAG: hypothetical protein HPY76_08685, partial [Anaerolineae bacterium]|nr:hypothetical protein [Anaerolineae bacterium]
MKIITNHSLVKRNKRIGQIATFSSLAILAVGLVISFQNGSQNDPSLLTWSMAALVVGFFVSQIGIYYTTRWGRSPRPDEMINQSLKGLENKFTIYHYSSPVSHLLLGPAGIWIILPYYQGGTIQYDQDKNRWRQKGGNIYLKIFAQENLGRPDLEVEATQADMHKFMQQEFPENAMPKISTVLVFTNEKA